MLKRVLLSLLASAALLFSGLAPAQVAVDSAKTGIAMAASLLGSSASAVIIPSSGSSNATGQITHTTALPAQPVGTVRIYLPAGVVTAGSQGTGAGLYSVSYSSTTVCQLTGTGIVTANAAYTQVTTEQVLATDTIPGGSMGINGAIESRSTWSTPNNANSKNVRGRLGGIGGTAHLSNALASVLNYSDARRIRNRNSASAQVASAAPSTSFGTSGSVAIATGAIDTSVDQTFVLTGQLTNALDFIILEARETWLLP